MKRIITLVALIAILAVFCGCNGCNKACVDGVYKMDEAVISMPDGTIIRGKVQSWIDYADGDQIQVTIDNVCYLVHSSDIVMIAGESTNPD